ncbi:hypothetical protein [Rufibacter hautae]|uniref:Uncharacterized protein n=1 Tax=Rufibacter hautae TaxID=2595005 RepID=A0A5B6TS28_9BACT|nr:hypothetical protein [Rufibacter hautae]KAA3439328.1 hypothetical protein FOA19_01190 [Rufibacter hautae]
MMKFASPFLLGFILIIVSNIIGHYKPSFSLMATAVLPFIIVGILNTKLYKINFLLTVMYGYVIILFNDWLVRVYAWGIHNQLKKDVILLLSVIAFILCSGCMLIFSFTRTATVEKKTVTRLKNSISVVVCGAFAAAFYFVFLIEL